MPRKGEYQDLSGRKFNLLTVLEFVEMRKRTPYWKCRCDCGNETIVAADHLKSNHTRSCGCWSKSRMPKLNYKHGLSKTKLYYAYRNMLNRCNRDSNDMYRLYGARGITVCNDWLGENGFCNFSEWALNNGYKEGLQIDRINNDVGYSPSNCRWVDRLQQANNKRNNVLVMVNGEVGTVGNMARKHGIDYWNLLHYAKGGKNCMYPDLEIEVVNNEQYV